MKSSKNVSAPNYQNNPFYVAIDGLRLFFAFAQAIAFFAIAIILFMAFSPNPLPEPSTPDPAKIQTFEQYRDFVRDDVSRMASQTKEQILAIFNNNFDLMFTVFGLALIAIVYVRTTISAMFDYTASRIAKQKKVSFIDAFNESQTHFFGYLWLRILVALKIFAWSLLFIVPGIIMSVRYSLAGPAFFDRSLGAQASTKHSANLTKGAWLTTNASFFLLNTATLGILKYVLDPGTKAVLYAQLGAYDEAGLKKPKAHILSWISLLLPVTLTLLIILLAASAFVYYFSSMQ